MSLKLDDKRSEIISFEHNLFHNLHFNKFFENAAPIGLEIDFFSKLKYLNCIALKELMPRCATFT